MLVGAHHAGRLQFSAIMRRLATRLHSSLSGATAQINWVVYAKVACRRPLRCLRYLSRYNSPLRGSPSPAAVRRRNGVNLQVPGLSDRGGPTRYKTMTLATNEFIRRFRSTAGRRCVHRADTMSNTHLRPANATDPRHWAARAPASRLPARPTTETPEARSNTRASAVMPVLRQPMIISEPSRAGSARSTAHDRGCNQEPPLMIRRHRSTPIQARILTGFSAAIAQLASLRGIQYLHANQSC